MLNEIRNILPSHISTNRPPNPTTYRETLCRGTLGRRVERPTKPRGSGHLYRVNPPRRCRRHTGRHKVLSV